MTALGQYTPNTWADHALCINAQNRWFFEQYERDENVAKAIDEMCLVCPVMKQCLAKRQATGSEGLWGAVYWNKLGVPDKTANSHKTPEIWERIKDAITD